jgi:hypothetical protein
MKTIARLAAAALLFASTSLAADQSWLGKVSDSNCGASHKAAEHGAKMTDADCVAACVKAGAKYVLVSRGKVYQIANQDFAGLADRAGHMAKVNGNLSGDTITITSIAESSKKK